MQENNKQNGRNNKELKPKPPNRKLLIYMMLAFFALTLLIGRTSNEDTKNTLSDSQFRQMVERGEIEKIRVRYIEALLRYNVYFTLNDEPYKTGIPRGSMEKLYKEDFFIKHKVDVATLPTKKPGGGIWAFLPLIIWIAVFYFIFRFIMKKGGMGGIGKLAKAPITLFQEDKRKITFKDVAGCDEVKKEMEQIIEFLKNPKRFTKLGGKMPKGILLVGPPGCGKTYLTKAVAGEARVPFYSTTGSNFVEMFVGMGAARVRDTFNELKKHNEPAILFIDEMDVLGKKRGTRTISGAHEEAEQTLSQLLTEMDGFTESNTPIIIIGATNKPDVLDPALLRPGRMDRQIVIDRPDLKGREAILKVHLKDKIVSSDINWRTIAKKTPLFTGADLASIVNEAAIYAAEKNKNCIEQEDVEWAVDRVMMGLEQKSKKITKEEQKRVAYHEAGHTLVAELLPNTSNPHQVSIIPRGVGSLGHTIQLPEEEKYLMTDDEIKDTLSVLFAGRIVEKEEYKNLSTGAQNDLDRATGLARQFVCRFGMASEELGQRTFGTNQEAFIGAAWLEQKDYSEEIAVKIDKAIGNLTESCYRKAEKLIKKNMDIIKKLAIELMDKETLKREEIVELTKDAKMVTTEN